MGSMGSMAVDDHVDDYVDIVIVGAGPVGLMLSTCLARWGYRIRHVDDRAVPTAAGRADGLHPRSLDILRNMGLKSQLMANKPARIYEVTFWDPAGPGRGIARTGTCLSCPDFIDGRYQYTALLHQGHIERVFIDDLKKNGVEIQRPWTIRRFESNSSNNAEYPVRVELEHVHGTARETLRAKYLFGGEGARSFIRKQLNIQLRHRDPVTYVWGVIDGVVQSDFPDLKMKSNIHSDHGSMMFIPREDGQNRCYVQLASSADSDSIMMKSATEEQVQAVAKKILHPYTIEWDSVTWFSVYTIGQGISERYTLDQRVFLGGDACHTHSPKAGQGMNTAFVDALNLAWKIHAVEGGFANRDILETYESERRSVAEDLIDFDARYAKLFCERPPTGSEVEAALAKKQDQQEDLFIETFKESCEFTTGYGVSYGANIFNWSQDHSAQSPLIQPKGVKLAAGRLFIPSDVTRVADANVVHLEQEIPMNGSFRLFIFAGHLARNRKALEDLAKHLNDKNSFYSAYARPDAEKVSPHEKHNPHSLFFSICTIFAAKRQSIEIVRDVPGVLARYSQHIYADDRWDRKLPNATAAAHAKMGLDEEKGGVVVVRPDGYVSIVTALQEGSGTVDALNDYFSTFCTKQLGTASA